MKHLILLFCLVFAPFATAADNAQLVQTNVNVQNKLEATKVDKPAQVDADKEASVAVQQDVVAVQPKEEAQPQPQQASPQPAANANVQLLKEANSQYQYQINSRYEEKTRPVYGEPVASNAQPYVGQSYPYAGVVGYPYYKENNHYQELGNGQRRTESNVAVNEGLRSQYDNQDQSTYTHQRSQSYSEYGKGESSPEYNTYTYKRMYY